jgi:hypothetical protein
MNFRRALVWGCITTVSDVVFVRAACRSPDGDVVLPLLSFASLISFRASALLASYFDENAVRADWAIGRTLRAVEAEATAILSNLLPTHIVSAITHGTPVTPRICPRATVLVLDLVEFTALASTLSSRELMETLNAIYSKLDELVEASGLWKVSRQTVISGRPFQCTRCPLPCQ